MGEVLRRLIAKCVLSVAGEAQEACGMDQLCGGLQAGIESGVHAMHSIWETHKMEEKLGFISSAQDNKSGRSATQNTKH